MKQVYLYISITATILSEVDTILVDMSHITDKDTLYYPTQFAFNLSVSYRGYYTISDGSQIWLEYNALTFGEHIGTHMDAPAHFADGPGYWRIHEIPVDHFIGPAVVIDISYKADVNTNPDASVIVEDLVMWEEKYGRIPDGAIVFCYSGWDQYWGDEMKFLGNTDKNSSNFHWPGFGREASQWLVDNRNIVGVGADTMLFGPGNITSFPEHIIFLSQNIYGLENVNNLGKIPNAGARVYVFPSNFRDASGTPTRIVAEFDSMYLAGPYGQGTPPKPSAAGNLGVPLLLFGLIAILGKYLGNKLTEL